jgi:hypothetical protein
LDFLFCIPASGPNSHKSFGAVAGLVKVGFGEVGFQKTKGSPVRFHAVEWAGQVVPLLVL